MGDRLGIPGAVDFLFFQNFRLGEFGFDEHADFGRISCCWKVKKVGISSSAIKAVAKN